MTDTHERFEEFEGYIISLRPDGGRIRPFRRRADLTFARDQAPDFDHLQRLDSVTYRIGPVSPVTGRRHASDVRALAPQTPPRVLTDPSLCGPAAHAERVYTMRRAGIQARWEAGDLSIQQRAALFIDCEFDRANRLSRLEPREATPYVQHDGDLAARMDAIDQHQEDSVTDRQTGTVDRLTDKGYGFIRRPRSHASTFFHARNVAVDSGLRFDDLAVGQDVTFLIERDGNGRPYATDVRPRAASATPPDWPSAQGAAMNNDDDEGTAYDWGEAS